MFTDQIRNNLGAQVNGTVCNKLQDGITNQGKPLVSSIYDFFKTLPSNYSLPITTGGKDLEDAYNRVISEDTQVEEDIFGLREYLTYDTVGEINQAVIDGASQGSAGGIALNVPLLRSNNSVAEMTITCTRVYAPPGSLVQDMDLFSNVSDTKYMFKQGINASSIGLAVNLKLDVQFHQVHVCYLVDLPSQSVSLISVYIHVMVFPIIQYNATPFVSNEVTFILNVSDFTMTSEALIAISLNKVKDMQLGEG